MRELFQGKHRIIGFVKMKIGIIGYGVVGRAIEYGFKDKAEILILDPAYKDISVSMEQMTKESDFIFIGVPTPMNINDNGKIDTTIIDSVIDDIASYDYEGVVISKSTVTPSQLNNMAKRHPSLRLCMSPEYLIDANPIEAFIEEPMIVVGSNREEDAQSVLDLFKEYSICKATQFFKCDLISAGILKYMENCFLALKVTFMNQMHSIHQLSGSTDSWDDLVEIFHGDPRMGNSHGKVPGPDGDYGWGGKCFVKDVNAMTNYTCDELGYDFDLMKKAWEINMRIRTNKDWLKIPGATINKID